MLFMIVPLGLTNLHFFTCVTLFKIELSSTLVLIALQLAFLASVLFEVFLTNFLEGLEIDFLTLLALVSAFVTSDKVTTSDLFKVPVASS